MSRVTARPRIQYSRELPKVAHGERSLTDKQTKRPKVLCVRGCRPFVLAQTANAENRDLRAECSDSERTNDPDPGGFHFGSRSLPPRSLRLAAALVRPVSPVTAVPRRSQYPGTSPKSRECCSRDPERLAVFARMAGLRRTKQSVCAVTTGWIGDPGRHRRQHAALCHARPRAAGRLQKQRRPADIRAIRAVTELT